MKKSIRALLCLILVLSVALCVLTACNGDGQSAGGYTGKYYEYNYRNEKNPNSWIELKAGNKWTDGDDSGTYSIKDGKISIMQDNEEIMSGSISDGIMVLDFWGMKTTYKKDGASGTQGGNNQGGNQGGNDNPNPPTPSIEEYTVTFYLNYGANTEEKRQTSNKKITYQPTRSGYTFNGWWTSIGTDATGAPILSRRWNMSDEVTSDDLVLYADWYETIEEGQLRPPTVIVDGYDLSWDAITNADGYNIRVTKDRTEISSENINRTSWSFNQSLECGVYTISIRANGNGVNSTNSSYTTRTISHRVLGSFEALTYNKNEATVSWSGVEGATDYVLAIDYVEQEMAPDVFTYSVANLDAGQHTVTIYAKRDNWQTSSRTLSFNKDKLKTPDDVRASFNSQTNSYVIVWGSVRYADSYKIYEGSELIDTVTDPTYSIDAMNWGNSWKTTKSIKIVAFDSDANYLQSTYSQPLVLTRMSTVTVGANDDNAGEVSASINQNEGITLTFDYNYKDCPEPITQVITAETPFDYPIPTREGYTFSGWFEDARLSKRYDFSKGIRMDTTFYASWYGIEINKLNLNQQYRVSTSTSTQTYTFISYVSGTYTLYFRNGRSGQRTNVSLREETNTIYSPGYQTNTSNKSLSINVTPGYIYALSFSAYSSSYTGDFYFEVQGQEKPTCEILTDNQDGTSLKAQVGKTVTMTAETKPGYTFLGWYNDNTKLTDELTYSTKVKVSGNNYTARWTSYIITLEATDGGSVSMPNGIYADTTNAYMVTAGDEVTVTASTSNGYTWLGWYDGETKVSENTSFNYTFTMSNKDKTYMAKWIPCPVTLDKNISIAGSVSGVSKTVVGEETTITASTNSGYTWLGWYDGDTKISEDFSRSYTFIMSTENKTYTAKWMICPVTLEKNINEAGSVSGVSYTTLGAQTTITANTSSGYTWLGWYDGETKISEGTSQSYTFTLSNENKTYTAKWYKLGVEKNISEAGTVSSLSGKYNVGDSVTLTANTSWYSNYTWLGWYDGDEKVSEGTSLSYTLTMPSEMKTYTAKWGDFSITTDTNLSGAGTYTRKDAVRTSAGTSVTLTASTYSGYTWLGWYDGDTKVSEGTSLSYAFAMPYESKTYTAKWGSYTITTETNLSGAGTYTQKNSARTVAGTSVTLTASTNSGYTWLGWYDGDDKVSEGTSLEYTFTMPYESKTYTAKWASYSITTNTNLSGAGTYTKKNAVRTSSGVSVTLTASTNNGYTWLGWYDGDDKVSEGTSLDYTFTMPEESKTYTAKWSKVTVTRNNYLAGSVTTLNGKYVVGDSITIEATTNNGYTWLGWYDGETKVSDGTSLNYSFTMSNESRKYTAKWVECPIVLEKSINAAGSVSGVEKTVLGAETTITATTNNGYTWLGWYDGDEKVSEGTSLSYTFIMTSENKKYTAKWACYTVTTSTNLPEAGIYTQMNSAKMVVGETCTLTATINNGYTWLGWYDGDTKVSEGASLSYTFTMSSENKTFFAKYGIVPELSNFYFTYLSESESYKITDLRNRAIQSIIIPHNVTEIEEGALSNCGNLVEITIPFVGKSRKTASDTYQYPFGYIFGASSYTGGTAIEQCYYGSSTSSTTKSTYYIPSSLKKVTVTGGNILFGAFSGCSGLTSIAMPDSVTNIDSSAFSGCSGLTSIAIPDSVTNIGSSAFSGCSGLTSIAIPDSVTDIGSSAFSRCSGLTSIAIPDSVTDIGSGAFSGCSGLVEIQIPFIGARAGITNIDKDQYPLGYIFGTSNYTGGTATCQHYHGSSTSSTTSTWYYIPTSLKKVTVTGGNILFGAFDDFKGLTNFIMGSSVTSITRGAFRFCSELTNITVKQGNPKYYSENNCIIETATKTLVQGCKNSIIPTGGNVTNIGSYAFEDCSELASVAIPDIVTSIGGGAFSGCSGLEVVYITDIAKWCGISFGSYDANPLYFAHNLYLNGELVIDLVIPNSVTSIGSYAFYGCRGLTSVTIPDSVTSIGSEAFENCSGLASITIPNGVKEIGHWAFRSCSGLTIVNWNAIACTSAGYGDAIFENCANISTVNIGDSVTIIPTGAFSGCSGLTSITIPRNVTSIGGSAFSGCSGLTEMIIPFVGGSIKTVSDKYQYPFGYIFGTESYIGATETGQIYYGSSTSSLTKTTYYIPTSLKKVTVTGGNILRGAFSWCSNLDSVIIGSNVTSNIIADSVTSIGVEAFRGCSGLTSVTISDSVTSIGSSAFSGCSGLTEITIPFVGRSINKASDTYQYPLGYVFGTSSYEGGTETAQSYYGSSTSSTTNTTYYIPSSLKTVTVTGGNIPYGAFHNCSNLTSVIIGSNVTSIGTSAFRFCSGLTSVIIGDSVTSIGTSAFYGCSGLKNVTIPQNITSIGSWAFYECSGLTTVNWNATACTSAGGSSNTIFVRCTNFTTLNIGGNVTMIPSYAFDSCTGLTSVTIPDNVMSIGSHAFYGCSKLTSIKFNSTSSWYRTDSSSNWNNKTGGTSTSVTNTSTNATYFKSNYANNYWYKL